MIQQIVPRPCPGQELADEGSRRLGGSRSPRSGSLRLRVPLTPARGAAGCTLHGATRGASGLVQAVLVLLLIAGYNRNFRRLGQTGLKLAR